jgi:tubulin polyglutamylase TTLL6/13
MTKKIMHVDLSVGPDRLMSLKQGQKINHMYGMLAICRKKSLFQSLSTMRKYVNFNKISSVVKN